MAVAIAEACRWPCQGQTTIVDFNSFQHLQGPFLVQLEHRVSRELYIVLAHGLVRLDELEGTKRGHNERLPLKVVKEEVEAEADGLQVVMQVEAYYAHRSYAEEMWRNSEKGYNSYTHKVVHGYVKRKDRPPHLSFLDHIRIFLSSSDTASGGDDQVVENRVAEYVACTVNYISGE